jgi:methyl-accepting chemotaxis protein
VNIEEAVQKHAEWKLKFRTAISKQEKLDARLGSKPEFQKVIEKHKAFHVEAGKVASLINAGKYAEAEASMGYGTSYASVSNDVGVALMTLKKVVAQ